MVTRFWQTLLYLIMWWILHSKGLIHHFVLWVPSGCPVWLIPTDRHVLKVSKLTNLTGTVPVKHSVKQRFFINQESILHIWFHISTPSVNNFALYFGIADFLNMVLNVLCCCMHKDGKVHTSFLPQLFHHTAF